jgi:hypothetical protein
MRPGHSSKGCPHCYLVPIIRSHQNSQNLFLLCLIVSTSTKYHHPHVGWSLLDPTGVPAASLRRTTARSSREGTPTICGTAREVPDEAARARTCSFCTVRGSWECALVVCQVEAKNLCVSPRYQRVKRHCLKYRYGQYRWICVAEPCRVVAKRLLTICKQLVMCGYTDTLCTLSIV